MISTSTDLVCCSLSSHARPSKSTIDYLSSQTSKQPWIANSCSREAAPAVEIDMLFRFQKTAPKYHASSSITRASIVSFLLTFASNPIADRYYCVQAEVKQLLYPLGSAFPSLGINLPRELLWTVKPIHPSAEPIPLLESKAANANSADSAELLCHSGPSSHQVKPTIFLSPWVHFLAVI